MKSDIQLKPIKSKDWVQQPNSFWPGFFIKFLAFFSKKAYNYNRKMEKDLQCVKCLHQFNYDEVKGRNDCPRCHTFMKPLAKINEVTLTLNWQELRNLTIWAHRYILTKEVPLDSIQAFLNTCDKIQLTKKELPLLVDYENVTK